MSVVFSRVFSRGRKPGGFSAALLACLAPVACLVILAGVPCPAPCAAEPAGRPEAAAGLEARARREKLLEAFRLQGPGAAVLLAGALDDRSPLVRRTAAHLLARLGEPALPALEKALENDDFQVRRIALGSVQSLGRFPAWRDRLSEDPHISIRRDVEAIERLVDFLFPVSGWRFRIDPQDIGRDRGWYREGLDDGDWLREGRIEASWNEFLEERYIGVAWYRREVLLPPVAEWDEAWLEFGAVDESAWVWVNGQYAGSHDIGPLGWNKPFRLEVGRLVRPGEKNLVVVRAMNTSGEGGIHQPVRLSVPMPE